MNDWLKKIVSLLSCDHGLDVTVFADSFLLNTINRRIEASAIENSLQAYFDYLSSNPEEVIPLSQSLINSHSDFFRNPLTFALLEQLILPALLSGKKNDKKVSIRVWSSACAAGQEAYSIAILLDELAEMRGNDFTYQIFATDASENQLELARLGNYDFNFVQNVSLRRVRDYFKQSGNTFGIIPKLKRHVDFSYYNLLDESRVSPPAGIYGDFDLVICSNLLFYYKPKLINRILQKIHNSMSPEAFLVTSEAEQEIVSSVKKFLPIHISSPIFRKAR